MLLAVEGGGFFSASASGYSKALTLLLLGQKNEDRPVRVLPWNRYQLVDQDSDTGLQLASKKNRLANRCAAFVCFHCTSAELDTPPPLKVGLVQDQDVVHEYPVSDKDNDAYSHVRDYNIYATKLVPKSNLKKHLNNVLFPDENGNKNKGLGERVAGTPGETERRKVQWIDAYGHELVEIREYEPSEADGSDDEFDNENERRCSCAIM